MNSTAQDSWQDIAQAMRLQLEKLVPRMMSLSPADLKTFIEAARDLFWIEVNAHTFDKEVDLKLSKIMAD